MGAITKGSIVALFATTQGHDGSFVERKFYRVDVRALMGAVAERLLGAATARAPTVRAGGQLDDIGSSFCNDALGHKRFPVAAYSQV